MKARREQAWSPTASHSSPQTPQLQSTPQAEPVQSVRQQGGCSCEGGCPRCESKTATPPSLPKVSGIGQPLAQADRDFFEPRLGEDLSQVRLHTDEAAQRSAGSLGARAFTLGQDIVFGQGEFAPQHTPGRRLLAHELAHVVQQRHIPDLNRIQATFLPNELLTSTGTAARPNPIATDPDTYFYAGLAVNNPTGRRALVVAGLHGDETSSWVLGTRIREFLDAGGRTDFHVVVIPHVSPGTEREYGGFNLNREFGQGYRSASPYAARVTDVVNEFNPERILSIHCIGARRKGGIYLDPLHAAIAPTAGMSAEEIRLLDRQSYPDTSEARRADLFAGDARNLEAMRLTERMIGAVTDSTMRRGNQPRENFPASRYPGSTGGESPYSLLYPEQGGIDEGVSLGQWGSAHGITVVTIELPGNNVDDPTLTAYLSAAQQFLTIPSPAAATGTP